MSEDSSDEELEAIGEAAEALWDATRRMQDLLDDLEEARLGRWAAYTSFREAGAVFRFAMERLQMGAPPPDLAEIVDVYRAGAHAGFEAAADLAEAVGEGGVASVDMGVQRLAMASQQFVRGRYLLQRFLDARDGRLESDGGSPGLE